MQDIEKAISKTKGKKTRLLIYSSRSRTEKYFDRVKFLFKFKRMSQDQHVQYLQQKF